MELLVHSQSDVILYLSVADLGVDPGVYEEYCDQLLSDLNTLEVVHLGKCPHHVLLDHLPQLRVHEMLVPW